MSSSTPVSAIDTGILLEAGTNEAEVLVFRIRGRRFGVNVAKVREVLPLETVTDIPRSHTAVDGLVDVREAVMPLVNLGKYLYADESTSDDNTSDSLLLLEFNKQNIAFRVQGVERIFRVSWKDTLPAPQLGEDASPVTSILRQKEGLVPLLDFESICATIGLSGMATTLDSIPKVESVERSHMPIIFADDSRLICEMIKDSLVEAGYTSVKGFSDGQDAWNYLAPLAENSTPEDIRSKVACIVTDIEMPRMDGLNLTKKIREHPVTADLPVIVFSSIATKDNEKKGLQVGATAQVSKPHYDDLVATVDGALQASSRQTVSV
jgi:two-component system chemotaxis response regulator CheV